ncbi:MAG TPA: hypothetical protein PK263_00800 [bacterium]|nr:hypothetical protein [bacterium]
MPEQEIGEQKQYPSHEISKLVEIYRPKYNNLIPVISFNGAPLMLSFEDGYHNATREWIQEKLSKYEVEHPEAVRKAKDTIVGMDNAGITPEETNRLREIQNSLWGGAEKKRALTMDDVGWYKQFIETKVQAVYQYLLGLGYSPEDISR